MNVVTAMGSGCARLANSYPILSVHHLTVFYIPDFCGCLTPIRMILAWHFRAGHLSLSRLLGASFRVTHGDVNHIIDHTCNGKNPGSYPNFLAGHSYTKRSMH